MNQQEILPQQQAEEESGFDFKLLFFNYFLRYWYFYVISLGLALSIAYFYMWYAVPVYEASGSVMVKQPKASSDAADILRQLDDFTTDRNIQNEMEVLHSRNMISKTVSELNFDISYFLKGNIKTTEVYNDCPFIFKFDTLRYFAYSIPVEIFIISSQEYKLNFTDPRTEKELEHTARFGTKVTNELGTYVIDKRSSFNDLAFDNKKYEKRDYLLKFNLKESLISKYRSLISIVLPNKTSSMLNVSLEDPVPDKAVDFINKLFEVWLRSNIEDKNELAKNSLAFIDNQLALISRDLDEVESEYEKFRSEKGITDVTTEAASYLQSAQSYDSRIF